MADSANPSEKRAGDSGIRQRWYRLYYLLAAFDIITVCVSVYLGHRVLSIYRETVDVNLTYSERRRAISELDKLAADVNAPGNDIFETKDVAAERQKLRQAMVEFKRGIEIVRADFTKNLSREDSPPLIDKLNLVDATAKEIESDTEQIFATFSSKSVESAGKYMAGTERKHTAIIKTLASLRADSRAIERKIFANQEAQAKALQRYETGIFVSLLLMVMLALVYGHKLARQFEADAAERQRHLDQLQRAEGELRTARDQLEQRVTERTAELKASEEQRRYALDSAKVGTWSWDIRRDNVHRSENVAALFGRKPGELESTYEGYLKLLHDDDRTNSDAAIRRALDNGNEYEIEHRVLWPDGSIHWLAEKGSVVRDASGPVRMAGTITDISARKNAELALQESEQRYHTLFDATFEAIAVHDNGIILDANPAFTKLFGYSLPEVIGRNVLDFCAPESREKVIEAMRSGREEPYEATGFKKDGTKLTAELLGKAFTYKGRPARVTALRDITARKQAEQALIASEERYRQMFENHPQPMWIYELPTLRFLAVNAATVKRYGFSREEFLNMKVTDIRPPESVPSFLDAIKNVTPEINQFGLWPHRAKDGRDFLCEITSVLLNFSGREARLVMAQDVTEKHLANEKLKRHEADLSEAQRLAHFGSWSLDFGSDTVYWSDEVYKIYGRDPAQGPVTGTRYVDEIIHPDDRDFALASMQKCQTEGYAEFMQRIRRPDGEIRHIDTIMKLRRNENGTPIGVFGACVDVTEQKRAEEALKKSEELYRTLIRNFPNGAVMLFDRDLRFTIADGSGLGSVGLSKHALEGRTIWDVFPADICRKVEPQYRAALAGQPGALELTLGNKTYSTYALPVKNELGEIFSAMVVAQDLTDRKQLEDQLRQTQKMEAIGSLAGGVAHDFNNLLMAILGNCELLKAQLTKESPLNTEVSLIQDTAMRATALTRQLLAFSRRQVLQPKVVNMNTIVADMERLLRRVIGESIDLRVHLAPDLGAVKADPGQLEQVIMNLAINSRDAMPKGGRLTLETCNFEMGPDGPYMKPGAYVLFSVSDMGCGMSPEVKARLFEPFFTTKDRGKGTGLGLATVYGIVKQSDGHIWVFSEPGKGTTFKIYLPRVKAASPTSDPRLPAIKQRGTETVLLVEDEEEVRRLTLRMLEQNGYAVIAARTGFEALDLCQKHPGQIDLLLTDVVMPGMSGPTLAQSIKGRRPAIKILYMSGYTDDEILHHGITDHQMEFLQKPFGADVLALKIRQVLDGVKN